MEYFLHLFYVFMWFKFYPCYFIYIKKFIPLQHICFVNLTFVRDPFFNNYLNYDEFIIIGIIYYSIHPIRVESYIFFWDVLFLFESFHYSWVISFYVKIYLTYSLLVLHSFSYFISLRLRRPLWRGSTDSITNQPIEAEKLH